MREEIVICGGIVCLVFRKDVCKLAGVVYYRAPRTESVL